MKTLFAVIAAAMFSMCMSGCLIVDDGPDHGHHGRHEAHGHHGGRTAPQPQPPPPPAHRR